MFYNFFDIQLTFLGFMNLKSLRSFNLVIFQKFLGQRQNQTIKSNRVFRTITHSSFEKVVRIDKVENTAWECYPTKHTLHRNMVN